jgi:hypothetical protein
MSDIGILSIGKPFGGERRQWPEALQWRYDANGHMLIYSYHNWQRRELAAIEGGRASFAFTTFFESSMVIVFQSRFAAAMPWSDSFYTWHMVEPDYRKAPEVWPEAHMRALCSIVAIDANGGEVQALRVVTFSPQFTRALHQAIIDQAARPFSQAEYDRNYRHILANYSTKELRRRALASCVGGEDDRPAAF